MTTIYCITCRLVIKRVFPETPDTTRESHIGTYCDGCLEIHDAEMARIRALRPQLARQALA